MPNNKWVFIVNPVAGGGFTRNYVTEVKKRIAGSGIDADIIFTERPGHATELAQRYARNGYGQIIAVGGDGTVNEIVKGVVDEKDVVIGIIPAGTGNDFVPIIGFAERFSNQDWEIFFQKNTIRMDIGKCNDNYFVNGLGLGFDAQVAAENYKNVLKGNKGGKHKYLWHIIKTILFYDEQMMQTASDENNHMSKCFINTVSIGRRFAGGFFLTPKAIGNDGLLDVCMIHELNRLERFRLLPQVPKGTHLSSNKVNYYQTRSLTLQFETEVPHHLDGEVFFASRYEISILPAHLEVIYNPYGSHYFNV